MDMLVALKFEKENEQSKVRSYLFLAFGQYRPETEDAVVKVVYFVYSSEDAARIHLEHRGELSPDDDRDLTEILDDFVGLPQTSDAKPLIYYGDEALQHVSVHHQLICLQDQLSKRGGDKDKNPSFLPN